MNRVIKLHFYNGIKEKWPFHCHFFYNYHVKFFCEKIISREHFVNQNLVNSLHAGYFFMLLLSSADFSKFSFGSALQCISIGESFQDYS